ncbi:NAD(P)-dependent alcohol dehydrogenase [Paractinoplanes atraurantiacus]|uniref:Aryl-alcohol dehydrogenase n=1 Tax=Paractinoplanes atraurantiacus TaxID=1036182 RepID=A0A285JR55_9ACTN|nr:NAD(P)-dependent alcohol dehydrogenase [Actinoplanes atraurantiacus]SNY62794.1 aryl-alcohol dehydrogenase [Actinoplanes atraurantiacus]
MRIRAALVEEAGGPFVIRDVELEEPRADEVLVRMTAAGICHTDLAMRRRWSRLPMVFGHEGAGVVEAVGPEVGGLSPGDTVCLTFRSCGACDQCRDGHPAYCGRSDLNARGTRADGSTPLATEGGGTPVYGNFFGQSSFATHALAYESNTIKVPADLPPTLAAPLGCSVQTGAGTVVNVLRPRPGETVAVLGAGAVGLSAVMAAVAAGCEVLAVDPVPERRALALELGAADRELAGVHHAIDTTGRPDVIDRAVHALRRRGTLALVGLVGRAELDLATVLYNGLRVRGVIEGDASPAGFIPWLVDRHREGRLPVERLVAEFAFEQIEAAARSGTIKPVLTFR